MDLRLVGIALDRAEQLAHFLGLSHGGPVVHLVDEERTGEVLDPPLGRRVLPLPEELAGLVALLARLEEADGREGAERSVLCLPPKRKLNRQ
jgi:hypothetical protein